MKKYSIEDIPAEVLYVKMCGSQGIPIGYSLYMETLKKYPEYFVKEVESMNKWDKIPFEVKSAHFEELTKTRDELYKDAPHANKGILYYVENPDEYKEYKDFIDRQSHEFEKRERELHKKYFGKYGV